MGMEAELDVVPSIARSGRSWICSVISFSAAGIEGAGSDIVRRVISAVGMAGVGTRETTGNDCLVCRGLNGMGLLFHWPRSADVRKKVVRFES